jgi:hypothetical protein
MAGIFQMIDVKTYVVCSLKRLLCFPAIKVHSKEKERKGKVLLPEGKISFSEDASGRYQPAVEHKHDENYKIILMMWGNALKFNPINSG